MLDNNKSKYIITIRTDYISEEEKNTYLDIFIKEIEWYMNEECVVDFIQKKESWYFGYTPFCVLATSMDKLKYVYANYVWYNYSTDKKEEFKKIKNNLFNLMQKNVSELKNIVFPKEVGIDSNNFASFDSWLTQEKITIEEFILDPKYIVICECNNDTWADLKKSGIINTEIIEEYE